MFEEDMCIVLDLLADQSAPSSVSQLKLTVVRIVTDLRSTWCCVKASLASPSSW